MFEGKTQTLSPFIILQEDIVFNYSFSLTSYSLFLYPIVEKTALRTVFSLIMHENFVIRSHRFFSRPFNSSNPTRKAQPPQHRQVSSIISMVALTVPPVAKRSSTIRTR